MNKDHQKRNSKGKFRKVKDPKKHVIRLTDDEKRLIDKLRKEEEEK